MAASWTQITTGLHAITTCLEEGRPDAELSKFLVDAQRLCDAAATRASSREDLARVLTNVKTAVETWQNVWPRLGQDKEFRLAVAREARLWAKRLSELLQTS